MRLPGIVLLLASSVGCAQAQDGFKAAVSNVLDTEYPKVDSNSRIQIRFKVPEAIKVKLNFWSGPKEDMEKEAGDFWTITSSYIGGFSGAANVFLMGNDKLDTKTAFHGAMADPGTFAKRVHLLWIGVGTDEPDRMRSGLEKLHASLDEGKIQHVFYESTGTSHEWQTWRRDLKDFAPRLFQPKNQPDAAVR